MTGATKIASIGSACVACGCCVKVCPRGAVYVDSGVTARVDRESCIGCGKCAKICPAAIITILERKEEL